MAAGMVPAGRSLLGKTRTAAVASDPGKPSAVAAFLGRAREHVVTVAALAAFDLGAFQVHVPHLGMAPGLAAVGVSLLLLDFAVRG